MNLIWNTHPGQGLRGQPEGALILLREPGRTGRMFAARLCGNLILDLHLRVEMLHNHKVVYLDAYEDWLYAVVERTSGDSRMNESKPLQRNYGSAVPVWRVWIEGPWGKKVSFYRAATEHDAMERAKWDSPMCRIVKAEKVVS
jgi:hypothetical protein